jgi:hypothetical protein
MHVCRGSSALQSPGTVRGMAPVYLHVTMNMILEKKLTSKLTNPADCETQEIKGLLPFCSKVRIYHYTFKGNLG